MTQTGPDGVQRVGEILDLALERPPHERVEFIAGLCAGDDRLQREATSLLRALDRAGHLLDPITLERLPAGDQSPAPDLGGLVVGPYRIGDRIGAGGMGVVYAAQDTRLGRTVAVKSLPAVWALDPGRREMLEHEAKVLAALSHQNIGAIYGIEDCPHGPILVLEHVAGKTLAEQLAEGPLPIDEARSIARQILLALEAAHAAAVVHRDIKPSNVKLTPSGTVKVLDFGIAKLRADPVSSTRPSSAAVGPMTAPGQLIGTPAYMSPEQARGRSVDQRADLWAFGCVLYEMLAGAPAFRGETATDTIAAILRSEPDWTRLSHLASLAERRLLHRCLEKDPEKRLRNAGDARLELDEPTPDANPAQSVSPVEDASVPSLLRPPSHC
jgi:serine/threonine protein kinase